jgi:hypothetical protein
MEQILAIKTDSTVSIWKEQIWCAPNVGIVKLNVAAALLQHSATLAVVARDHNGELLKAWTKSISTEEPWIAEASAILWALDLDLVEKFQRIAEICYDTLNGVEDCNH